MDAITAIEKCLSLGLAAGRLILPIVRCPFRLAFFGAMCVLVAGLEVAGAVRGQNKERP